MKIAFESELMENQKHAVVMAPEVAFEVLESQQGDALFFSIGTDGVFYVTREVQTTVTGWNKIDLSSGLSAQHGGAPVSARAFRGAQNAQSGAIDLALALTAGGTDYLYLSLGNANSDDTWAKGITWTAIPFDAGTAPSPLTIADVYIMNIAAPGGGAAAENIFVDVIRDPNNQLQLLDRYYITPGTAPQWNLHKLAVDLAAGSISSCLGNRTNDPLPGIYTFGAIGGEQELIFTPQYNYFQPTVAPSPARLSLPAGASAATSAFNSAGVSNLFVAATGGLYLFTPDNQGDQAVPVQVVANPLVAGASTLAAATSGGKTAVWGVDPQGNLFYVSCAAGSEANAAAWSNAVPLLGGVEKFAFFLNNSAGTNNLFAHLDGQSLIQLSQDAVTTDWRHRAILLPSTNLDDMAVYTSFTTHIQVTDDYGVGSPNAAAQITATSAVSVYVNDVYFQLSPTIPVSVTADPAGVITVVQETQSLSGVCLQLALASDATVSAKINPMSKALATLNKISDGKSLGAVQVPNADGSTQPLVGSDVAASDKDAAASSLVNFVKISSGLPRDGSRQAPTGTALLAAAATPSTQSWGIAFEGGGFRYHEGADSAVVLGLRKPSTGLTAAAAGTTAGDLGEDIKVAAGDFFRWLKNAFKDVEKFVVEATDGVYHFFATVAGKIYDVLLDCIDAVVHAVEFVFNKIKVFFEDLVKWLGFIFQWGDILNTHKVLKKVLKLGATHAADQILNLENDVKKLFDGIESKIDDWAGIPSTTDTVGSYQSRSSTTPGYNSPQSNWGLHHTKGNAGSATTTYTPPSTDPSLFDQILNDLKGMVDAEVDDLKTMVDRLKTEVIDPMASLTASEVMKRLVAIITDALLTTAENLIVTALDLLRIAIKGVLDLLDAPIRIPILSAIYRDITKGDELSFLDLTCLVAAIPITIIYKLVAEKTPFTQAQTDAIMAVPNYDSLAALFQPAAPQTVMLAAVAPPAPAPQPQDDGIDWAGVLNGLNITASFAGLVGGAGVAIMAGLKKALTEAEATPAKPLRYLAASFYLPYVAPDIIGVFTKPGKWFTILNDFITAFAIGKTFADNTDVLAKPSTPWAKYISPVIESVTNVIWLFPAGGMIWDATHSTAGAKTADWLNLAANLSFDVGGIVTFATSDDIVGKEAAVVFFVVAEILTAGYALICAGTGIAQIDEA